MYRQKNMYRRLRDNPGMVMPGIPQCTVVHLNIFWENRIFVPRLCKNRTVRWALDSIIRLSTGDTSEITVNINYKWPPDLWMNFQFDVHANSFYLRNLEIRKSPKRWDLDVLSLFNRFDQGWTDTNRLRLIEADVCLTWIGQANLNLSITVL